jgi:hypothetical protein
MFDFFIFF